MPGLYIHIPFCRKACHYCNFHFSTSLKYKSEMLEAIAKEAVLRRAYLPDEPLGSVYLGGGTPSLLNAEELAQLFEVLHQHYTIAKGAEITLEANPDDLTEEQLKNLAASPVNRLSIGIQSFFDADLTFMNRAHNASEARRCIDRAHHHGFTNLTIDLIYGSPSTSNANWQKNMDIAFSYAVPHLSCYCLTVEPKTALDHFVRSGRAAPVDEEQAAQQFEMLVQRAQQEGYEHYEISNFARPGHYARHNTNYWKGEAYLGLGPSAHSFNGQSRQWNIANNAHYRRCLDQSDSPQQLAASGLYEIEALTMNERYNEYIMTGLRTIWGCDLTKIQQMGDQYQQHFLEKGQVWIDKGHLQQTHNQYFLSNTGKLLADRIAMELFVSD
ncbi:MAG: radical SAM family heme chaperone HemW [Bacteroidota bacterium]